MYFILAITNTHVAHIALIVLGMTPSTRKNGKSHIAWCLPHIQQPNHGETYPITISPFCHHITCSLCHFLHCIMCLCVFQPIFPMIFESISHEIKMFPSCSHDFPKLPPHNVPPHRPPLCFLLPRAIFAGRRAVG